MRVWDASTSILAEFGGIRDLSRHLSLNYYMVMCNSGRVRIDILYEEGKIACLKHNQNFITSSVFMIDNFWH